MGVYSEETKLNSHSLGCVSRRPAWVPAGGSTQQLTQTADVLPEMWGPAGPGWKRSRALSFWLERQLDKTQCCCFTV